MKTKTEIDHAKRAHAKIGGSPSGIDKGINCSQSVVFEEQIPNIDTKHTTRGTQIHEVLDIVGNRAMAGDADLYAGITDSEALVEAEKFVAIRSKTIGKIGQDNIVFEGFEVRVELTDFIWGSADWVLVYKFDGELRAIVWDHKFGRVPVSPVNNTQGKTYAAALREKFPWVKANIIIFQPLSGEDQEVKQWQFSEQECKQFKKKLLAYQEHILKVKAGEIEPVAKVGEHCRWCRGKVMCATYKKDLEDKAMIVLDAAPPLVETTVGSKVKQLPDVKSLTKEQRAAIIEHMDTINSYTKAVMAYEIVLQKDDSEQKLDSFKLVNGRSVRGWKKDTEQVEAGLEALGCQDIHTKKIKGIGEIEKQLIELAPAHLSTKKAKKELATQQISELVEMSQPAPKLVAIDDPRQGLNCTSAIDLVDKLK